MTYDALRNLRKLPEFCYGILNNELVVIHRGALHPSRCTGLVGLVDARNKALNVTPSQRAAMEGGVTFGWNHKAADPETYLTTPNGREVYQVQIPLMYTQSIEAFSAEDAIERVTRELELPEGFDIDGSTTATAE